MLGLVHANWIINQARETYEDESPTNQFNLIQLIFSQQRKKGGQKFEGRKGQ